MQALSCVLALALLCATGVAAAQSTQTPAPATSATNQDSSSTTAPAPAARPPGKPATNGASKSATRAQLQNCIKEQRANNPAMTPRDVQKYCESQLDSTPSQ